MLTACCLEDSCTATPRAEMQRCRIWATLKAVSSLEGCVFNARLLAVLQHEVLSLLYKAFLDIEQASRKHLLGKGVSCQVEERISEHRHHGQDHGYQCDAPYNAVAPVVLQAESSSDLHGQGKLGII